MEFPWFAVLFCFLLVFLPLSQALSFVETSGKVMPLTSDEHVRAMFKAGHSDQLFAINRGAPHMILAATNPRKLATMKFREFNPQV